MDKQPIPLHVDLGVGGITPPSQVQIPSATEYLLKDDGLVPFKTPEGNGRHNGVRVTRFDGVPEGDCEALVRAMHEQLGLPNTTYEVKPDGQGRHEAYLLGGHTGPVFVGDMVDGKINPYGI